MEQKLSPTPQHKQNGTTHTSTKPPIVLIHGLWMTSLCWEEWATHFQSLGHQVIASSWPGLDGFTPAEIRAKPKALEGLHINTIVDHYAKIMGEFVDSTDNHGA
jgi:non-heme chloroperoxidase